MKQPSDLKDYLKAKSPESLKVLMLKNNIKTNAYHDYVIIYDGQNWFAWFERDMSDLIEKETVRAINEGNR